MNLSLSFTQGWVIPYLIIAERIFSAFFSFANLPEWTPMNNTPLFSYSSSIFFTSSMICKQLMQQYVQNLNILIDPFSSLNFTVSLFKLNHCASLSGSSASLQRFLDTFNCSFCCSNTSTICSFTSSWFFCENKMFIFTWSAGDSITFSFSFVTAFWFLASCLEDCVGFTNKPRRKFIVTFVLDYQKQRYGYNKYMI